MSLMLQASPALIPLWHGLEKGMTPEAAAAALRGIDGISTVQIERKKGREAELKIEYSEAGISVGPRKVKVDPSFVDDRLSTVTLSHTDCDEAAEQALIDFGNGLQSKYPNRQRETVVNDKGVVEGVRQSYFNAATRVTVSLVFYDPETIERKSVRAYEKERSARRQCYSNGGKLTTIYLEYRSQVEFTSEQRQESDEREKMKINTADGL
ncbi:hypothetical protein U1737_03725 [Sphingomonas sp. LB3N6]|uniref:hypothetical protein n=1 Tax=Sphingomonas fucosidasi TaxID=3096164 RepID=UPI002FCA4D1C